VWWSNPPSLLLPSSPFLGHASLDAAHAAHASASIPARRVDSCPSTHLSSSPGPKKAQRLATWTSRCHPTPSAVSLTLLRTPFAPSQLSFALHITIWSILFSRSPQPPSTGNRGNFLFVPAALDWRSRMAVARTSSISYSLSRGVSIVSSIRSHQHITSEVHGSMVPEIGASVTASPNG
jgi:hypothetical protein